MNFKLHNNDQIPKHVEYFIETLPKHQKFSNVYEITVEDKDGKILDTKYGVNTMTTRGFQREVNERYANCYHIIIGKGTGTTTINDTLMFEDIPGIYSIDETRYTLSDTSGMTNTYDPVSNCLIGRRLTGSFVMDYETKNDDVLEADGLPHITEFAEFELAYGNYGWDRPYNPASYANSNIMHTHCLIYDENHDPSYFEKIRGTKVTVKIYRANKIDCSLFNTLWDQGVYLFISPSYMVKDPTSPNNSNSWRMLGCTGSVHCGRNRTEDDYPLYKIRNSRCDFGDSSDFYNLLRWYNWGYGHSQDGYGHITMSQGGSGNWGTVAMSPSGYRNNITFSEYIQTDTNYVKAGIVFLHYERSYQVDGYWGYRHNQTGQKAYANAVFAFKKINLIEPEEMELDFAYTDDFLHPQFRNIFGLSHYYYDWPVLLKQQLPCNDFHLTSVKTYNYLTDDWEDKQFTDDPDYDFRNPERSAWGHMFLSGFKNGATFDVYLNVNTQVAIEAFNEINIFEIYMTDTYWDYTSFVRVTDHQNVPAALQHKKYIIKYPSTNASNSSAGMAKSGLHPQREVNKHAIVLSDPITKIDTPQVSMVNYDRYSYKKVYASDEGWAFCNGTLIYLESDDGTGHPYRYTINVPATGDQVHSWELIKYTPNRIIVSDARHAMIPTDVTNPRVTVYEIDPTQPEVDPNTTAVIYYDQDFMFGATSKQNEYFGLWCYILCDPNTNRMYFERNGNIYLIDLNNHTHNITSITDASLPDPFVMNKNYFGRFSPIFGTDCIVGVDSTYNDDSNIGYRIYDVANLETVGHFLVPRNYSNSFEVQRVFGYQDTIYVQVVFDGTYHIFTYNYDTEELVDHETWCWNYLYFRTDYVNIRMLNAKENMFSYDNDAFVVNCCSRLGEGYNNGARSIIIAADEPENPYFFDYNGTGDDVYYHRPNSYITIAQRGIPFIKKFNNGKDWMVMLNGASWPGGMLSSREYQQYYHTSCSYVFNFGYIKNKQLHSPSNLNSQYVIPLWKHPAAPTGCLGPGECSDANNRYVYHFNNSISWFSEACFYKNKVLVFTTFDQPFLVPIDTFLFYQIKGTTKTLQAHNHPRKYNTHSHGLIVDMIENM